MAWVAWRKQRFHRPHDPARPNDLYPGHRAPDHTPGLLRLLPQFRPYTGNGDEQEMGAPLPGRGAHQKRLYGVSMLLAGMSRPKGYVSIPFAIVSE